MFGKSAVDIINHLLENLMDTNYFYFKPLLRKSLKDKDDDIGLAIDGEITPEQAEKMKIIFSHMKSLDVLKQISNRVLWV